MDRIRRHAVSMIALSQGATLSAFEPGCTFSTACEEADGVPDDVCSIGTNSGEWVVVTDFGFNLPASTTSIDGYLVEAKVMTSTGCSPLLQLHVPALVGEREPSRHRRRRPPDTCRRRQCR